VWQWAALALALAGGAAWPWLKSRVKLPGPNWAWEVGCVVLVLLLGTLPLLLAYGELFPARAPMGPDANNYVGSALAMETGRWELYFDDRYPAYPWLVSVFAADGAAVPTAGTAVSMGLTALTALPLYAIGRLLAGRVAGVAGAVLGLRQAVVLDAGRSFTHYPLSTFVDASLLAAGLFVARTGSPLWAWALSAAAGLAIASDPKQLPLALGTLVVACAAGAVHKRPWWHRAQLVAACVLPLPAMHALVGRYRLGLLTLEGITVRTPMNFTADLRAHMDEGFALGEPGALGELIPSYVRVLGAVAPKGDGVDPSFTNAIPMHMLDAWSAWGLLLLLPLGMLLWKTWKDRSVFPIAAVGLLLLQAASASSVVRLHYAHRYALPHVAQMPVVATSGVALAGGPLAVAGLAVGWLLPGAPMNSLGPEYLERQAERTDLWVGREHTAELDALTYVIENTDDDAVIYDMSQSRPMPILAAGRPYIWCSTTHDNCGNAMQTSTGSIAAVVWANDFISSELPQGPRELIQREGGRMPTTLGRCWELTGQLQPEAGLYRWTCDSTPRPWPDKRKAPRAPTWDAQGAGKP
jgi:hypothetical protein